MQKTYSQIKPKDFDIEKADESGMSTVLFFDNIEEIQTEEDTLYSYNMYKLKVPSRANLEQTIEQKYDEWLKKAKDTEAKENAKEEITKLQEQLNDTDYKIVKCMEYQLAGIEIPYNIAELHEKRQKLRDKINELQKL